MEQQVDPPRAPSRGHRSERIVVEGSIQGVGFRPLVYRIARSLGLSGTVQNTDGSVVINAHGEAPRIDRLVELLQIDAPVGARIDRVHREPAAPLPGTDFRIVASVERAAGSSPAPNGLPIGPDLATCTDCLEEIRDETARRYGYPFTNCTACGPRTSIVESFPYDRERTTMRGFAMCEACRAEFEDPDDRRFHAQPIACPQCGPQLSYVGPGHQTGEPRETTTNALETAAEQIRSGRTVAVLGLGGFHLICDATDDRAVATLRLRKDRGDKPFAVMFPDLGSIARTVHLNDVERTILTSPKAPIVLARRRLGPDGSEPGWVERVAPANPALGVFLPYTPLHHLLLQAVGRPVVATSGNRRDEPIQTTVEGGRRALVELADGGFLVHDRPIARPIDDSVVRVVDDRVQFLRRARGATPEPIDSELLPETGCDLAVGGHLKNTVAIRTGRRVVFSPHLGDLETIRGREHHERSIEDLRALSRQPIRRIVCDAHPDYASTISAEQLATLEDLPLLRAGHHRAHVLAVAAEHGLDTPIFGAAWDGTGYGEDGGDPDGNIAFGGEFFEGPPAALRRIGRLRPFPLLGGDRAARSPWRAALGALFAWFDHLPDSPLRERLEDACRRHTGLRRQALSRLLLSAPITSSAGRLFDAMAFALGLSEIARYEADAAVRLERAAALALERGVEPTATRLPVRVSTHGSSPPLASRPKTPPADEAPPKVVWDLDPSPLFRAVSDLDVRNEPLVQKAALDFHESLARALVDRARRSGRKTLCLSGGCFCNRVLLERTIHHARASGLRPFWPERVPPNDGGLALGQLAIAALESPRSDHPTKESAPCA